MAISWKALSSVEPLRRLRRGRRLGKYQLLSRLGEGGFSEVWKARDTIEGIWVALKISLQAAPGSSEEEELLEEIRLSARLDHPNILRVRNADRIGGILVVSSELALESLDERLQRRLGVRRALSYLRQILDGLAFAHRQRVIHRDLKPSNILLFPGDRLHIADFGLAKLVKHSMISATGSGTLLYLAPEQAHGYPCFASDVFSTGLICYQMLTGKLPRWPFEWPFEGSRLLEHKVPAGMVHWVRKALRPDYRDRFHDATEMLRAFVKLEPELRRHLRPPVRRRRRRSSLGGWREFRFREFQRAFGSRLFLRFRCPECDGPISEHMAACPWCGFDQIAFGEASTFPYYCERCRRGLRDEWPFCPWCWGPGFPGADGQVRKDPRYEAECSACKGPLIAGMVYCPWCHSKLSRRWRIPGLQGRCGRCRGSVCPESWDHCPWCGRALG